MDENIHEFKILFVGPTMSGKSSTIQRYVEHQFTGDLPLTIAATQKQIPLNINDLDITLSLNLWDLGSERDKSLIPMYYRGITAAVIFFDVSNTEDLKEINDEYQTIKKYAGEDTLIYLAGNKNDLQWDSNYVKKYIKEKIPVLKTFFISAKENIGVDDMFNTIICDCYNLLLDSNKKSSANKPTIKKKEKLFTFLFLGDISSGKPLFINLLIDDSYSEHKNSSTDLTKYTYKVKGKNILYYI